MDFLAQSSEGNSTFTLVIIGVLLLVLIILALALFKFINLWIQAYLAQTKISLFRLVGMQLRKTNPTVIVRGMIGATQAGLKLDVRDMEAHYLAGGNVPNIVTALIAADRANLNLDFRRATAIDLAGRDLLDAVRTCVNPKVIDCPEPSTGKVVAMARNGIQVLVRARVTVRANIDRLVGGATEETIIARVGEGIISSIGSSDSHKDVLENPAGISKTVLGKSLDAGTAYEIVSMDIADVDIGDNIGARLQTDQAETDKRIAQAAAEARRAMAVAVEQENAAEVMANRAKLVLAEAEVPRAMVVAFRSGNLGVFHDIGARIRNRRRGRYARGQERSSQTSSAE